LRVAATDGVLFSCDGQVYGYLVVGRVEAQIVELTPAEREVAALVASGCSNREIASRRAASVHTIGNQLASIYGKFGVTSRHELIARLPQVAHEGS
jgi:DNA-binding CsgD family transcriptional regulator